MKTIKVYILKKEYRGEFTNISVTFSEEAANSWYARSLYNDYDELELTLPQEIQVQSDY